MALWVVRSTNAFTRIGRCPSGSITGLNPTCEYLSGWRPIAPAIAVCGARLRREERFEFHVGHAHSNPVGVDSYRTKAKPSC